MMSPCTKLKHAKVSVLIDTDIFIDYFNTGRFHALFDSNRFTVYYSIITKKELLTKPGLREAEREALGLRSRPRQMRVFGLSLVAGMCLTFATVLDMLLFDSCLQVPGQ